MKKIFIITFLVLLIALFVPTKALAREVFEDKVVFGGTFTLEEGQTHEGSLVVFGGAVTIEKGSRVDGDVVLMGGTVEIGGIVNGIVVGIGGAVRLNEGADVLGDLFTLGAALRREEGANVRGQIINGLDIPNNVELPDELSGNDSSSPQLPIVNINANPFLEIVWFFFRIFMYAALAVIIVMFLPKHIDRVAKAAISEPVITGAAGLLTAIGGIFALIAMAITIILIPVSLLGILVLFAAWLVGWIALGTELGRRIAQAVNMEWAPAISAGVGTFILFFVFGGLQQIIPCIGWLPYLMISFWSLGAVLMTRFGTRQYVSAARGAASVSSQAPDTLPEVLPAPGEEMPVEQLDKPTAEQNASEEGQVGES